MRRIIVFTFIAFLSFCSSTFSQNATSLAQDEHLLDGKSFTYQYQGGSAVDISFAAGQLTYQWIAGRNAGKPAKTYAYKSRKLGNEIYFVNWHEPELGNYITLVYNLENNTCASSVIVRYNNENPITAFEGGIIEHLKESKE